MNEQERLLWAAKIVLGLRPATSGIVTIGDNGRHKTHKEYRLILSFNDELCESGELTVSASFWQNLLKSSFEDEV